jgi:nucleoside-diphosphate-sugar epimerase
LRLFHVYEYGLSNSKLHGVIERCVEKNSPIEIKRPEDILDFIHVRDAISLISSHTRGASFGAHNVCTGIGQNVLTVATTYAKRLGFSGEIVCLEQPSKPIIIVGDL